MSAIDQIVAVSISQDTRAVAQDTFSIPLILAKKDPGWPAGEVVHTYTSAEDMLSDGFVASDIEYVYVAAMYAQTITPAQVKVARRGTVTLQQTRIYVDNVVGTGQFFKFKLNGVQIAVQASPLNNSTAYWVQKIADAVEATGLVDVAYDAVNEAAVLTGKNEAPFTITDLNASAPLPNGDADTSASALSMEDIRAASGLPATLARVEAADPNWYGLAIANPTDTEILTAAPWVESAKKIFVAASGTSAIATGSTTDVASQLKTGGYNRTAVIFSPAGYSQGVDAAWLSSQLAQTPGSNAWAFKSLAGVSTDTLTPTQVTTVIGSPIAGLAGKNGNVYTAVAGVPITQMGTAASGQYLDITVGLDWLHSQIQTNVYRALVAGAKLPYTDAGTAVLISAVRSALDQGIANGLIDGASENSVSAPAVASVSSNQRAQRIAPTISFKCRLQGAFNAVTIRGTVTV